MHHLQCIQIVRGMGHGAFMAMSGKQKINAKSSTESKIVGMDDASTPILWGNYFTEAQGFKINETIVYQDNISSSYLLVNRQALSSKRTKHMNMRYFFLKDRIKNGEMTIKHCPTKQMLAQCKHRKPPRERAPEQLLTVANQEESPILISCSSPLKEQELQLASLRPL